MLGIDLYQKLKNNRYNGLKSFKIPKQKLLIKHKKLYSNTLFIML